MQDGCRKVYISCRQAAYLMYRQAKRWKGKRTREKLGRSERMRMRKRRVMWLVPVAVMLCVACTTIDECCRLRADIGATIYGENQISAVTGKLKARRPLQLPRRCVAARRAYI